ncbi:MAG: hypothetical protein WAL91_07335 [Propionicimonas sp.]
MKRLGAVLAGVLGVMVVLALIAGGVVLWSTYNKSPLPIEDRCVATAGGNTTTVDPDQAHYASIIAGLSIKRELAPRAASIALATAYQESGIRNLDYGHADSIGLFQQRPSKGWGTIEEIMDPWYSAREFYRALERVKNWQTKDINDVAQAVQRSAYPEAYRRHETNARTLASSLTGETPASFRCQVASPNAADPDGMRQLLTKTLGAATVTVTPSPTGLTVTAKTPAQAWAVAHIAVANAGRFGLQAVQLGPYGWTHSPRTLADWIGNGPTDTATAVTLTFATATPR